MDNEKWQDSLDKATVLSELARTYWAEGDYEKAQDNLLQSLGILETEFGPDHIPLVRVLHSLGLLARVRIKYDDSERYYKRALKICETLLGPEAQGTAIRLNYLAGLYNAQGDFENAELLVKRSLAISRKNLGSENQLISLLLMAMAILCKRQGKEAEAQEYRSEMKHIHQILDRSSDDVKTALSKLADFFYSQNRLDDADLVFRYGLILGEEQEFPQHPFVAESLLGLARLYGDYEAWNESAALYRRAIICWEKLKGPNSAEVQMAINECTAVLKQLEPFENDEQAKRATKSFLGK